MNRTEEHGDKGLESDLIPGIPQRAVIRLLEALGGQPWLEEVRLYGSRAKGTWKYQSDIDLCIIRPKATLDQVLRLEGVIDELLLPWLVDISVYDTIENPALREHIDRVGRVLWRRNLGASELRVLDR